MTLDQKQWSQNMLDPAWGVPCGPDVLSMETLDGLVYLMVCVDAPDQIGAGKFFQPTVWLF